MADAARHGRSGLDSRDLLDNAVRSSAERILPQFQQNPGGRLGADVEQGEGDGHLRRELKTLYAPPAGRPVLVDAPELSFLMVDGEGDPNLSQDYRDAVQALFAVSYAVKFAVKRAAGGIDYRVMPLEGLWWVDDMSTFTIHDKASWKWTAPIAQPDLVTKQLVEQAVEQAAAKRPLRAAGRVRLEPFCEGRAAQLLHHGPFSTEGPTIQRLHGFIDQQGLGRRGKHHENYLTDLTRTAPERLKTVIRQPVTDQRSARCRRASSLRPRLRIAGVPVRVSSASSHSTRPRSMETQTW